MNLKIGRIIDFEDVNRCFSFFFSPIHSGRLHLHKLLNPPGRLLLGHFRNSEAHTAFFVCVLGLLSKLAEYTIHSSVHLSMTILRCVGIMLLEGNTVIFNKSSHYVLICFLDVGWTTIGAV